MTARPDAGHLHACVGFSVPRTVGTAVVRNRVRRRLRAISAELTLAPGEYLITASPAAARLTFDELATHVRQACG